MDGDVDSFSRTRRSLHGVAELLLAGPQLALSGSIELRAVAGGWATVAVPDVRVEGGDLVDGSGRRLMLDGRTCAALARELGLTAAAPGVYDDGSGVSADEELAVDPAAADEVTRAFSWGDTALRALAPGERPVLWPEHFDIAVTVDRVNYGVSPGDATSDRPYAYVGPWEAVRGPFWNASFGAARPLHDLGSADAVLSFFRQGASLLP
jgi:hypothetical protein